MLFALDQACPAGRLALLGVGAGEVLLRLRVLIAAVLLGCLVRVVLLSEVVLFVRLAWRETEK